MRILLTSSKTMRFDLDVAARGVPIWQAEAAEMAAALARLSEAEMGKLMKVSDRLARETSERFRQFSPDAEAAAASAPALLAFSGDVYEAMAPENFDAAALDYAEGHLRILSGLYGMLRPLDRVQPYRLEMGYRFAPEGVRSLREFWKARLTEALRQELSAQAEPVVVNLASKEYSDAIDLKALPGKVITPVFKVKQGSDPARQVAIYAKRGRGALAGYLCRQQAGIAPLTDFAEDGWRYQPTDSTAAAPLFIREL